jgi:thioredoxin 1
MADKHTVNMTQKNFEGTIQDNDTVIIDFWAEWCGPCRNFGPVFEKAAQAHSDVVFAKVDTEEEKELAAMFNIRSIPSVAVFREGVLLYLQPGALPEEALGDLVKKVAELDMEQVRLEIAEQEKTAASTA